MLTYERASELLSYEPKTGILRWRVNKSNIKAGAVAGGPNTHSGYITIKADGRHYMAHRIAWLLYYGSWPPHDVDHKNLIVADNRIVNLRAADDTTNCHNRRVTKRNALGVKGVRKQGERYQARIGVCGKTIDLGLFPTVGEAHAAYCEAANRFFGEFARYA